jgi:hypothetical protein
VTGRKIVHFEGTRIIHREGSKKKKRNKGCWRGGGECYTPTCSVYSTWRTPHDRCWASLIFWNFLFFLFYCVFKIWTFSKPILLLNKFFEYEHIYNLNIF